MSEFEFEDEDGDSSKHPPLPLVPPPSVDSHGAAFGRIAATFTDLDGVIRHFPEHRDRAIESRYRLPPGAIRQIAFTSTAIEPALTGRISDGAWRSTLITRLASLFPEADCEGAVRDWSDFAGVVETDVLREIRRLRDLGPLVLLTNATSRLDRDLKELGIDRQFDQIVNSSSVGFAKPSYEIFKLALVQTGLSKASEVLFIDDSSVNIRTARGLGFATHTYRHVAALRDEVNSRLNPLA